MHDYQNRSVQHIKDNQRSMLMLDLGLGKTVSALTAISDMFNMGQTYGVLVIAPLRVAQTVWAQECRKWSHLNHLTSSLIHGGPKHRRRALLKPRHIYLLNYEGLPWFIDALWHDFISKGRHLPFDTLVADEITKLKSTRIPGGMDPDGSVRGEALLKILPHIPRRIGLTATPAPNGLEDLFGQYLILDDGNRLGSSMLAFRERFFEAGGYGSNTYTATDAGTQYIHQIIADMTIEMKGEDYLELPKIIENKIQVVLPPKLRRDYDKLELQMFMELDSGASIEAVNSLALMNKLLQFANGAMYLVPELPEWEKIHDLKVDALFDLFEDNGKKPMLVAYQYQHDLQRIMKKFQKIGIVHMNGKMKADEAAATVAKFNRREIPILIGHADSIGHGLNLQQGSNHVVFFGLSYNLELYLQFVGRLARQGQPEDHVVVHKIMAENTLDEAVDLALAGKEHTQAALRTALREYRELRNPN